MNYLILLTLICAWILFYKLLEANSQILSIAEIYPRVKAHIEQRAKNSASELTQYILDLNSISGVSKGSVPKFKFYGDLIEQLIFYRSKYGVEISSPVLELRQCLRKDTKLTKQINGLIGGALYQYFSLIAFIWFFYFIAKNMLGFSWDYQSILFVTCFQLTGLLLFAGGHFILKIKCFRLIESYLKSLYIFKLLLSVSRPFSESLESSAIVNLKESKDLKALRKRIMTLISSIKRVGRIPLAELDITLDEVWDTYDLRCEAFHKGIQVLKILMMLFFVLPSFLMILFLILGKVSY